jgi:hypothetical protein
MSKATDTIEPGHWLLALDEQTGQLRERRYELSVIVGPDTGRTTRGERWPSTIRPWSGPTQPRI